ncbi:hypothetical protein [Thalassotalea piscium]|uniref:Uncharacterized protein n=1 Tax=Thalassotalea piscium TaxID=1230533 RepID=A0A7X0TTG0_9GAMM|nr:hypothetical protein [Thalassotalea piscium]MBB6543118.1 hypothetical protein [Thalassotalea piscium]
MEKQATVNDLVFEVFAQADGTFVAFEYPSINENQYWELAGTGEDITSFEYSSGPIKVPANYESYGLARVSVTSSKQIQYLPCKPKPLFHNNQCRISPSQAFDVYIHPGKEKMWAIAQDSSGDVLYQNENTANLVVFNVVNLNATSKASRIETKVKNGYIKESNTGYFDINKLEIVT